MPARRKFARAEVQLRESLAESRRAGLPFEEAWQRALGAPTVREKGVRMPHATRERRAYLEAFEATRSEWKAAYLGVSTRLSRVLESLATAGVEDWTRFARLASAAGSDEGARLALLPIGYVGGGSTRSSGPVDWPETSELAA